VMIESTSGVAEQVKSDSLSLEVGSTDTLPEFSEALRGMSPDEEKDLTVTYPADYGSENLAGKTVGFHLTLKQIRSKELPELNDEFAKDMGDYATYADLRKDVRDYLTRFTEIKTKGEVKQKLLGEVMDKSTFEIPATMIESEIGSVFRKFQQRIGTHEENVDDFAKKLGIEPDKLKDEMRTEALKTIRSTIVLLEIAKRESLKADEAKYREVIESLAKRNNSTPEQMERLIDENQSRENIETEIVMESALELLYENAQVKKLKPISLEEFMKAGAQP
jgi:trigger factor